MPPAPSTALGARLSSSNLQSGYLPTEAAATTTAAERTADEMNSLRQQYRATPEQVERVRALLAQFEGTHNFHNYTVAREFRDRAAQRYMLKLEVSCGWVLLGRVNK